VLVITLALVAYFGVAAVQRLRRHRNERCQSRAWRATASKGR
jgi:hypothetical protein